MPFNQNDSAEPIMRFDNVSMYYHTMNGETIALEKLTLDIAKGEFVTLVGPSGCGKSTVLSLAAGLLKPSNGRITLNGESVKGPSHEVGYMLQSDHLFDWRTILKNVLLGVEVRGKVNECDIEKAHSLLKTYGLEEFACHYPRQLSGGMRQRAALIRTLMTDPDVLLLDEAFSALDYQTRLAVADEIGSIIRSAGKTCIMVTHDISEAISLSDRVIVFTKRPGKVKCEHEIDISEQRAIARRQEPRFREYFNTIWKELDVHVG